MEPSSLVFNYIGQILVAGGGGALIAYGAFKTFGAKWLDSRFNERLQRLKMEQDQALRHVQSSIDQEIHRAKKLYDREFDVLAESWAKLRKAFDASCGTSSEAYQNFQRLSDKDARQVMLDLKLKDHELDDGMQLPPERRIDWVRAIMQWRRLNDCFAMQREFSACVALNGPFMSSELCDRFRVLEGLIVATLVEFQMRLEGAHGVNFDKVLELLEKGTPLVIEMEGLLRERFWSASTQGRVSPAG